MAPIYKLIIISLIFTSTVWNSAGQNIYSLPSNHASTINFDPVYPNKNYRITLAVIDSGNKDEGTLNTLFTVSRLSGGQYSLIFSDSVFSKARDVGLADFNNDKVPDILVQNISDVRSNQTYYLYLVDTVHHQLKKIKGFEAIKNPTYLPEYNLVTNYVMSGSNWTSFYIIKDDTVKESGVVIYDNQTDDGSYERDYKKAVRTILKKEKKRL